jgi:carbohydrate-binding DOMON domain-containing protein
MPALKVLYLKNNPCVERIKNYRKTLISRIMTLTYTHTHSHTHTHTHTHRH